MEFNFNIKVHRESFRGSPTLLHFSKFSSSLFFRVKKLLSGLLLWLLWKRPQKSLFFVPSTQKVSCFEFFGASGFYQGPKRGGFKRGGFPIWTCPSFFVLFGTFPIFPGFSRFARGWSGDGSGDGPGIRPFFVSQLIKSTYEEQSRKGPRHNLDLSRKKWETPRFGNPPRFSSNLILGRHSSKYGQFVG